MKSLVGGLFTAFSLYSAIPVPKTPWDREHMRFALCFFPLVGACTGVLTALWFLLCRHFEIAPGLYGAVAALLPLLVTGGIHMDGFMDTADALSSHALQERKLEILKDSHVGAFGVVYCAGYLLLCFGLWQQIYDRPRMLLMAVSGYVLSRCCNALSIATFPTARNSGLVHTFHGNAHRRVVVACNLIVAAAVAAAWIVASPLWGGVGAAATVLVFTAHRRFCLWEFGGNTGDLAGFLLQNLELVYLMIAVIGGLAR